MERDTANTRTGWRELGGDEIALVAGGRSEGGCIKPVKLPGIPQTQAK